MKTGIVILISEKTDFKTKTVIRGKVGHYIKASIQVLSGSNTCKYVLIQPRSTKIHLAHINIHNKRN